jgi:hypothetical protein
MDNFEIYTLAQEVISSITGDLSNGIYANLTGNLTISWIERSRNLTPGLNQILPLSVVFIQYPENVIAICR